MTSGDFSRWLRYRKGDNFNGILYQQGRVFSDSDGTTQTRLVNDWQYIAGGDIIGRRVAAVPSDEPNSFKIGSVGLDIINKQISVKVMAGRVWVDGMLVHLEDADTEITRIVDYLGPPYHDVPPETTPDSKDAVILEVYQDAINGFQLPDKLIEPALGGPDTTEMLYTSFAFKLLRLSDGDSCSTIPDKLAGHVRGKLTASLEKNPPPIGECPVDENYGYTGLTHNLYRIEIAETNNPPQKFKWSQFNGGLVGRGNYTDTTQSKIRITHNTQAILWSGLTEFYLEIITYDAESGYWKTRYGTIATLNSEKELELSVVPIFGAVLPDDTNGLFFRLWNGIRDITEFTADSPPAMLIDGVRLKFEPPTPSIYIPGDYWTFVVRAGGLQNPEILLQDSMPQGIQYHMVPLSIIKWNGTGDSATVLEDCRVIFDPLIDQKDGGGCCCLITVGDGKSSHGDYDSLQDAINSIGQRGGEICLLEGDHRANVKIDHKNNLIIKACGNRTRVVSKESTSPIITIQNNSSNIRIQDIEFVAEKTVAIRIDGGVGDIVKDVKIQNNMIRSIGNPELVKALIEVINGISDSGIDKCIDIDICDNKLVLQEGKGAVTGIYLLGSNITVARNAISSQFLTTWGVGGGIQIGNGSKDISILQNKIVGGSGNGITLGDPLSNPDVQARFIYRVRIENNEISGMGLSGIGVPRLLWGGGPIIDKPALVYGAGIRDLQICGNLIHECLQSPFDESMLEESRLRFRRVASQDGVPCRGFGGILLTFCVNLIIKDNIIESNGRQHIDPVCGIFIFFLYRGQIIRNYIQENGPFILGLPETKAGSRGGVVLMDCDESCMIYDNQINQPVGSALLARVSGSPIERSDIFSVVNNELTSRLEDVGIPEGGCVRIISYQEGARIRFECNHSYINQFNRSEISHFIATSGGDLSFGSNVISCLNGNYIKYNTHLMARTLRAYDNRFMERRSASSVSLLSDATKLNITCNNQGDNCIFANCDAYNPDPKQPPGNNYLIYTGNQIINMPERCVIVGLNLLSKLSEISRSYEQ